MAGAVGGQGEEPGGVGRGYRDLALKELRGWCLAQAMAYPRLPVMAENCPRIEYGAGSSTGSGRTGEFNPIGSS